ncbi:hypothetical protein BD324DRAFT_636719 [Kockovaella imperatae]|uniref:Zn(2)-C6 fungal-type domain-containing protein n=1 Tax=Kockovaella imperatae TaxID=4999 RepID=A0A1Y1U9D8_9TREE|nr:hypothetical protein BD324DRAFT_636719 [Kockovaella imperatae]ORX34127.1 hypothetical protein BD324DRAFT_636719 [Kockovaella imperatae]
MEQYSFYRPGRSSAEKISPTTSTMMDAGGFNRRGPYGSYDLEKSIGGDHYSKDTKPSRSEISGSTSMYDHRAGGGGGDDHSEDESIQGGGMAGKNPRHSVGSSAQASGGGIPAKRGSKACSACRKGKNRCEPDPSGLSDSCRRCLANKIPCIFEKTSDRASRRRGSAVGDAFPTEAEGRVLHLERSVRDLAHGQNQIQSALQQILSMLPAPSNLSTTPTSVTFFPQGSSNGTPSGLPPSNIFHTSVSPPEMFNSMPPPPPHISAGPLSSMVNYLQDAISTSPQNTAAGRTGGPSVDTERKERKEFPKLPGFAPPNHVFGTYGIIPVPSVPPSPTQSHGDAASPSAESNTSLPRDSLTAPIQALQALANAADQAASSRKNESAEGENSRDSDIPQSSDAIWTKRKRVRMDVKDPVLRMKKKTKPDPTPRNPFPDVVTKGLVSETEARELWDIFFSGCHYFVPLWDKKYDTYETYIERTPFSTNGLLAVAAKIRAGNGPLGQTFQRCLEEAQGIARSTLFGPIVRKEAVAAMLILSVWSANGWMPCGHALRGALDMNLHRALDTLAAEPTRPRSEAEERDLVVSARIWLNCYMHDHLVSLGTGKPLLLNDESYVRHARLLLDHPMASETDIRLIAGVELVNLRVRVWDHLRPLHGKVDHKTISFVKRMFADMQGWYDEWNTIQRQKVDADSVLVKLLEAELVYAQMWTVCVALSGTQWDKLPSDQRELAFQAKDAAVRLMEIFLRSGNFRAHLKYATHDQLVSVAFAAVFLLKIAILYPSAMPLPNLISQVSELAHLLSAECFAERYALTLRLMLANFRRKTGALSTVPGTPRHTNFSSDSAQDQTSMSTNVNAGMSAMDIDGGLQSLLSLPQMGNGEYNDAGAIDWSFGALDGFAPPDEFSPSNLPVWLQDGNFTDLGLPQDGSDSLFLPPELASMFLPSGSSLWVNNQFALPDSGDVDAEAW